MKKLSPYIFILALLSVAFTGCLKEGFDPEAQFEKEKPIIAEYVTENLTEPTEHAATGIWYEILEQEVDPEEEPYQYKTVSGYLEFPIVHIKYSGRLLNGNQFDANEQGVEFNLGGLITAWQLMFFPAEIDGHAIGVTKEGLQKGMTVRFVTPSYYAYGQHGQGSIPGNSPLDFTIEVLNIKASEAAQN